MEFLIPLNISATRTLEVEAEHTAKFLGSGEVEVLATPMMIALMEAAALEVVQSYLASGWTTVGTKVNIEHLRPTAQGEKVSAEATLITRDDRTLEFHVEARDNFGIIGQGSHQRYIINIVKFMVRLQGST